MESEVTKSQQLEREKNLEDLRTWMPKGSTVYTILRNTSRSGMQRVIGLVLIKPGDDGSTYTLHPNYKAAKVLGRRESKDYDGIICQGGGMDMGFEIVYSLAHELYGDGYSLNQQWL